jgi:hypothetical protein
VAVLFVGAFAFLLASFPARNSDVWAHLSAGRQLASGPGLFGTAAGPGWLYDLLSYGLYEAAGGPGLVFSKALLVVGLALVLLRLSQTQPGWWVPAVCTALAILAMSTRLLAQPATVSYLLLALTLWLLRSQGESAVGRTVPLVRWPLLALFVVWVNLDQWFVLGLATVALVWLGEVLDLPRPWGWGLVRRTLSLALLAAVCLLNPSHVYAFVPPAELGWFGGPAAPGQMASPFQATYVTAFGTSPAALAYFPLLGLGLVSFVLTLPRWHWQRFLPWLGLAVLSALYLRTIPFFAVVGGPVLAWNLQEFFARRTEAGLGQGPFWRRASVALRALAVLLAATFLACAWPGWLQAPPFEPRRWAIETPPSLERGALATRRWHESGKFGPEDRGLHVSPETAHAFAWFCPEDKGVLDDELAAAIVGGGAAPADGDEPGPAAPAAPPGPADGWARRLRAAGINHLIVHAPSGGRLFAALNRLLADPGQWPLLYREGDVVVFGWRDPARPGSAGLFRGLELDVNRLAFRPEADRRAPRQQAEEAEPRRRWDAFWRPAPPRPIDRDEATLYLLYAGVLQQSAPLRHEAAWEASQSAGLVAAAARWTFPGSLTDAALRLVLMQPQLPPPGSTLDDLPGLDRLALAYQRSFALQRDDTPPALLYLAVRAARRALAANPEDARAYLVLGESYLRLLHETRERAWGLNLKPLVELRQAQASAALNQAAALRPDLAQAHLNLFLLYREMKYLDLALKHLRDYRRLTQQAAPGAGPGGGEPGGPGQQYTETLAVLAEVVEDQERKYAAESAGLRVLDRARVAAERGLAGKARDVLLDSDISAFGRQGMKSELELLLRTGRAADVCKWTGEEEQRGAQIALLGADYYHWVRAQALAATGDYGLAEVELGRLTLAAPGREAANPRQMMTRLMALMAGQAVLDELPETFALYRLRWRGLNAAEFLRQAGDVGRKLRQHGEVMVFRGLLALEEGRVDDARVAFELGVDLWGSAAAAASGAGLDFGGRPVAQGCLELLDSANPPAGRTRAD